MILFVDDERRYVRNYIEVLESAGLEVTYRSDVDEAFEFLNSEDGKNVELLVLDVIMPPGTVFTFEETGEGLKTGIEVYKKFRKDFPTTPVFILTNVTSEDVREFFENEKNCYFGSKGANLPFTFTRKICEVLGKPGI